MISKREKKGKKNKYCTEAGRRSGVGVGGGRRRDGGE